MPTLARFTFLCGILWVLQQSHIRVFSFIAQNAVDCNFYFNGALSQSVLSCCQEFVLQSKPAQVLQYQYFISPEMEYSLRPEQCASSATASWGIEGRGTSRYLCDNSFHTKMCAISKFSIYHPISSLYSRGLLRRWPTYFRYIKMTRYTLVFSSHKSLWSEWSSWGYYLWPSMEISEYGIRSFFCWYLNLKISNMSLKNAWSVRRLLRVSTQRSSNKKNEHYTPLHFLRILQMCLSVRWLCSDV